MSEIQSEPNVKIQLLIEIIKKQYDVQPVSLHRFHSDSGKHIYQVRLANGTNRVIRIAQGSSAARFFDVVHMLTFFEEENYLAERVVLTKDQMPISIADNWHLLMTTFLVGTPLDYTPASFSLLGKVVGQLHALKQLLPSLPQSPMLPTGELAFAQKQLAAIASLVPKQFFKEYELLETAILSFNRGTNLPTTLIHGDCHPANALLTALEQVTLFDWEEAGMGSASLDVGFLLSNCDGKAPWEPLSSAPLSLEGASIQAMVEEYGQHYKLTEEELNYLPDAIRFRSLVFGACSFAASITQHKNAEFSQWWWNRYQVAEEIADKARYYFER